MSVRNIVVELQEILALILSVLIDSLLKFFQLLVLSCVGLVELPVLINQGLVSR